MPAEKKTPHAAAEQNSVAVCNAPPYSQPVFATVRTTAPKGANLERELSKPRAAGPGAAMALFSREILRRAARQPG